MFLQDVRYSLRVLAKNPGFAAVAVLTLALGIGANTAMFSIMNALFVHPPGVSDPSRMLAVRVRYEKLGLADIGVSITDYADARDSKDVFSSVAAIQPSPVIYSGAALPQRLTGELVTWNYFDTFGVRPLLGRGFRPEEDQPGANHEAVLSYSTWKSVFGGDPAIVDKTIQLNQENYRVVGVMRADFAWPAEAQLWMPLGLAPAEYGPQNRFNESYFAVARVRPSVSVEQAQSFMSVLSRRVLDRVGYARDSQWAMFAEPLMNVIYGELRTPMLILIAAVGFVLLITCANLAGLMLARASGRSREMAVRAALGAGHWRLVRQVMTETLVLAGLGTVAGLALAVGMTEGLRTLAPDATIRNLAIHLDRYVLLFSMAAGLVSALLFGLAPAWQSAGTAAFERLKEGGRSGAGSRGRQRLRSALVVAEVSIALVLLIGAGLFLKSLARLQQFSPGFDSRGVMTAAISLSPTTYSDDAKRIAFYSAAADRLAQQPGVSSAAIVAGLPFTDFLPASSFDIEGRPQPPGDPGPHSDLAWVTPGFFHVLQVPVLSGRVFANEDRGTTQRVVVIDENLARQYWPNQNPIGQHLRRGPRAPWAEVIGVVGHVKRSSLAADTGKGICYYSLLQQSGPNANLVARTSADPATLAGALREAVAAVDSSQAATYDFQPLAARVANSLGPRRFAVTLLAGFAAFALLLASLGLYGIISYGVAQRTQEIGIRMALGAQRGQVLRLVIGQGMLLVGIGGAIGLVAAFALARLVASQLVQTGAFDPVTFLLTALVMATVTLLATYIPARRAAKVDPMVALRYE